MINIFSFCCYLAAPYESVSAKRCEVKRNYERYVCDVIEKGVSSLRRAVSMFVFLERKEERKSTVDNLRGRRESIRGKEPRR